MSLLLSHLEQISLSAQSIAALSFPAPKVFTNALLASHDITALIRDTEAHERALFSVPPPPPSSTSQSQHVDAKSSSSGRRKTVFNVTAGEVTSGNISSSRLSKRNTAVTAVLGDELNAELRRNENMQKGGIDIEVLLRGAEKLGEVYTVDGARERISALRNRHTRLRTSLAHYENKVVKQTRALESMNRPTDLHHEVEVEDQAGDSAYVKASTDAPSSVSGEDLEREEAEIVNLERRKKELEERVSGMERDLGGLLR